MAANIPTLSIQFQNVIVRTSDSLREFRDTVPIDAASWAHIADGEWVALDGATGKYAIPGIDEDGHVDLANVNMVFTLGKTCEYPRMTLPTEITNMRGAQEGHLPVYKGHGPVEVDFKLFDQDASPGWSTVGVPVYVVSLPDEDGKVRALLSTSATGVDSHSGKLVGHLARVPSQNGGFVRVMLNNL